jgi:hypothetical protein
MIDHMNEKDSSHPVQRIHSYRSHGIAMFPDFIISSPCVQAGSGSAKLKANSSTCAVQQFKQSDQKYGQLEELRSRGFYILNDSSHGCFCIFLRTCYS